MTKTELPSPPLLPAAWALAKDGCPYRLMYGRDERGGVYSWAPLYDQAALDEAVAAALERRREYDDALGAAERERGDRIRVLAEQCAEWHIGDGDKCGTIARELLALLRA